MENEITRKLPRALVPLGLAVALAAAMAWYYDAYVNWQPALFPYTLVALSAGITALTLLALLARGERKAVTLLWKTALSMAAFTGVSLCGVSYLINNVIGKEAMARQASTVALPLASAQVLVLCALLLRALGRPKLLVAVAALMAAIFTIGYGVPYMQTQPKWSDGTPEQRTLTDRLRQKKWGVFNHYLPATPDLVETIDTDCIAETLHEIGAGYYFITMMQGRAVMNAPNAAFDRVTGHQPGEACAKRDLILDLYESLHPYDIDLYVYFTGDGPYAGETEGAAFGFTRADHDGGYVTRAFVEKWACVLEEYALRYGDKVCGWWIDGCYKSWNYDDELLQLYYDAVKKGNPNALVAFNNGVSGVITREDGLSDYCAGEQNDFTVLPRKRFADGAQWHVLAPLGLSPDPKDPWNSWCKPGVKRDSAYLRKYIDKVNSRGGVVTIDIWLEQAGGTCFDQAQIETLRAMGMNSSAASGG